MELNPATQTGLKSAKAEPELTQKSTVSVGCSLTLVAVASFVTALLPPDEEIPPDEGRVVVTPLGG